MSTKIEENNKIESINSIDKTEKEIKNNGNKKNDYITINDIKKYGKFFALKTPYKALKQAHIYNQYTIDPEKFLEENNWWKEHDKIPKIPSPLKAPEIDRNNNPKGYNGPNNKLWGSALLCNEIKELKGYLTVIDIDNKEEIPLNEIEEAFSFIMDKTRVHRTGSGGYHIYLFSKEKPTLSQPPINIDYQKNGKYVVFDYRYEVFQNDEKINLINLIEEHYMELTNPNMEESIKEFITSYKLEIKKSFYMPINDKNVLIVENSDDILKKGLNNLGLKPNKIIATESDIQNIDFSEGDYTFEGKILIDALKPFLKKGHFHNLGMYLTGFLYKNYYSKKFTKNILNAFNPDGKGNQAIKNILNSVYNHESGVNVAGWTALNEYIKEYNIENKTKYNLLEILYTGFKRDISHPMNVDEYNEDDDRSNDLNKAIIILSEFFTIKSSDLESEKLLYYLYKRKITYRQIKIIFKELFGKEYWKRLKNAKEIFNRQKSKLKANSLMSHIISKKSLKKLNDLIPTPINYSIDVIKDKKYYYQMIQELIDEDEKISPLILQNYIEKAYRLRVNEINNYIYKPTPNGYKEIDFKEFNKFLMNDFGKISVGRAEIEKVFYNINQLIPIKYNILHFKNGLLEIPEKGTEPIFKQGEFLKDSLPKISFPFNWNPDATGGKIRAILEEALIIDDEGFDENLKVFFKSLGHSCMGKIENHIISIMVGPPGSSKSTILMMLKRGLSFSEVPISDIIKNERFALSPAVGKDINIDDDLQNDMWKGIGKLNTFIAGGGGIVEMKHSNIRITLNNRNTPKIWGASNNLPPVIGDGFERRLVLIKVPKKIDSKNVDIHLQSDILEGKYDEDLEWFYYTAITTYLKERNMPFVSQKQKEIMFNEYQSKSDSLFNCVNELFEFAKGKYVENGEAIDMIKKWHYEKEEEGIIFKEQNKNLSSQKIKTALERIGADKSRETITIGSVEDENGKIFPENKQKWVYTNIQKKKKN